MVHFRQLVHQGIRPKAAVRFFSDGFPVSGLSLSGQRQSGGSSLKNGTLLHVAERVRGNQSFRL